MYLCKTYLIYVVGADPHTNGENILLFLLCVATAVYRRASTGVRLLSRTDDPRAD